MDLQEWELVSNSLEIQDDDGQKAVSKNQNPDMDYLRCPSSPKEAQFVEEPNQPIEEVKEIIHIPENLVSDPIKTLEGAGDQDEVSQVFFKKIKENETVDMKLDSPTSPRSGNRAFMPRDEVIAWRGEGNEDVNMWKMSVNGIGAMFSFGVAAATICVIIFGSGGQRNKHNRKLRFQIRTDNKSLNQVVYQASKLNEAGVHPTAARITYGGYYETV